MKKLLILLIFLTLPAIAMASDYLVIYHSPQQEIRVTLTGDLQGLEATPIYSVDWQIMNKSEMQDFVAAQWVDSEEQYRVIEVFKTNGKVVINDHVTKTDKFIQVKITDTEEHDYTLGNLE